MQDLLKENEELDPEESRRRQDALMYIHIAARDIGMSESDYRRMLQNNFLVPTAAALNTDELWGVVCHLIAEYDWYPKEWRKTSKFFKQHIARKLQQRVKEFTPRIPNGEKRIQGLCRKLCGVDRVEWCYEPDKLKRLLAVMGNIFRREAGFNLGPKTKQGGKKT
ncbi:MAG: phage protein GemA/Gp16 family protein [Thermodesulfovibrionia bacterium]|nr:phage protein GemA/Gp16 family protein [Thermodesulfovibrionia bacterium]